MKVLIPPSSGFCPGVKRAERLILELREKTPGERIVVFGYMINNKKYIETLAAKGIETVERIEDIPAGAVVVVRTHGIDRRVEERLSREHRLVDLTCGNVKKIQLRILEVSEAGAFVLITGKKSHPEVEGLVSYAAQAHVVENDGEVKAFVDGIGTLLARMELNRLFVVSQTTGSRTLFESAIRSAKESLGGRYPVASFDSICPVTARKEELALELQKRASLSIVVGDRLSSNATRLFATLRDTGAPAYFVEDLAELVGMNTDWPAGGTALLVSSASTPQSVEDEIRAWLEAI